MKDRLDFKKCGTLFVISMVVIAFFSFFAANLAIAAPAEVRDVAISAKDISFTPQEPQQGDTVTITAIIENTGDVTVENVEVWFYWDFAKPIGSATFGEIKWEDSVVASTTYVLSTDPEDFVGYHSVRIAITPVDQESDVTNNEATASVLVKSGSIEGTEDVIPGVSGEKEMESDDICVMAMIVVLVFGVLGLLVLFARRH